MFFQSVTFDLDGTLLDTVPDLALACQGMLAELGEPTRSEAEIRSFVGKGMANLVERCLTLTAPPDAERLQAGIALFRQHYHRSNGQRAQFYPEVQAGLQAFAAMGIPLGVVTNKPTEFTLPLLEASGLAPCFRTVVCGDTTVFKKPHPEPLHHACRVLGVVASRNLHIGDSRHDIAAARAAGCPVFCVPYGYNEGAPVDSADCDALVSDLLSACQQARLFQGFSDK